MTDNRHQDKTIVSEAFRIREIEQEFCRKISPVLLDLGCVGAGENIYPESKSTDKTHKWNVGMRKNHKGHWDSRVHTGLTFKDFGYSGDSDRVDGKASVSEQTGQKIDGYRQEIDNDEQDPFVREIEESITLEHEESTSFNQEYHFEVTSETKATAGGEAYGGSVEQTLTSTFGSSFGLDKETSDSKSTTETVKDTLTVSPGEHIAVEAIKDTAITVTPYTIHGILIFGLEINLYNWAKSDYLKHSDSLKFDTILSFRQFLEGYNPDYPGMKTFIHKCSHESYEFIEWLRDATNRTFDVNGEVRKVFDRNARLTVKDLKKAA